MKVLKKPGFIYCLTNRKYYGDNSCKEECLLFLKLEDAVKTLNLNVSEAEADADSVMYMNEINECTAEKIGQCIEEYNSFIVNLYYKESDNPLFVNIAPRSEMYIISKLEIY